MRNYIVFLFFVTFAVLFPTSRAQDSSEQAPYLYWYSDYLNAFIIERADGTDSRIFGDGLMPGETNEVAGPGWSPSGEWFAWYAGKAEHYKWDTLAPFILNVDGQQMFDFPDTYLDKIEMEWSPTDDFLIFYGWHTQVVDPDNEVATGDVLLIDVAENRIIHQIPFTELFSGAYYAGSPSLIKWMPDGKHVIAIFSDIIRTEQGAYYEYVVYVLGIDGSLTISQITGEIFGGISSNGDLAYVMPGENTLAIQNLMTGEQFTLEQVELSSEPFTQPIAFLEWNPVFQYALFAIESDRPRMMWLLAVESQNVEEVVFQETLEGNPDVFDNLIWSPDGLYAAFTEDDRKMVSFSLETREITPLPELANAQQARWYKDHWLHLGDQFNTDEEYRISGRIHDVELNRVVTEFPVNPGYVAQYYEFWVSPDGRYGATIYEHPALYNFDNQNWHPIRPHAAKHPLAISGGIIGWHDESEWFMTAEYSLVAGGGTGRLLRGPIRASDGFRRDLSVCWSMVCAGWLPAQVDPEHLPVESITIPKPVKVLHGQYTNVAHLSWSPDSQYIASATDQLIYSGTRWQYVWNIESGQLIGEISSPESAHPILNWQEENGQFIPLAMSREEPFYPQILTLSPNGEAAIAWVSQEENSVYVIDPTTQEIYFVLENSTDYMEPFSYSPDMKYIMGVFTSERVQVWDATNGEWLAELPFYAHSVAFSPDGQYLAIGAAWDIQIYRTEDILQYIPSE